MNPRRKGVSGGFTLVELMVVTALEVYNSDMGDYPTTEQGLRALVVPAGGTAGHGWKGPYLKKRTIPPDPWKHPYSYVSPGQHHPDYDIASHGKDGAPGGTGKDADVNNWDESEGETEG
ncbi:MAG: type II secretion system major pseudopilin GspG [Candidatus Aureabacteria bacterium]|nr:type II secretion system major pseudopilin GspG [Candidatus Auribacterota bacterium]